MCIAINIFDSIQEKINTAMNECYRLREELSTVDKTISDILHELEFAGSLSASQGYKYAKMLKNLREDRRCVKNELEELQLLLDKFKEFNLRNIRKSLTDLEKRQVARSYTPRVLTHEKRQVMLNII